MSEFSDKPLVAGSVIGLRAFNVDSLGRLVSPSYPTIVTPGENVAECRKTDWAALQFAVSQVHQRLFPSYDPGASIRTVHSYPQPAVTYSTGTAPKQQNHTAGIIDCRCGWYAYFDGTNDYIQPDRVAAVVEGYGACTLGTRGYRAQKMRLVALIQPDDLVSPDRWARVQHNYPDTPVYTAKAAALAEHPLTVPNLPTPETCDDFWTREATA